MFVVNFFAPPGQHRYLILGVNVQEGILDLLNYGTGKEIAKNKISSNLTVLTSSGGISRAKEGRGSKIKRAL